MAWLQPRQAAKKSAREETFDAMEYVDSKVPLSWPVGKNSTQIVVFFFGGGTTLDILECQLFFWGKKLWKFWSLTKTCKTLSKNVMCENFRQGREKTKSVEFAWLVSEDTKCDASKSH